MLIEVFSMGANATLHTCSAELRALVIFTVLKYKILKRIFKLKIQICIVSSNGTEIVKQQCLVVSRFSWSSSLYELARRELNMKLVVSRSS